MLELDESLTISVLSEEKFSLGTDDCDEIIGLLVLVELEGFIRMDGLFGDIGGFGRGDCLCLLSLYWLGVTALVASGVACGSGDATCGSDEVVLESGDILGVPDDTHCWCGDVFRGSCDTFCDDSVCGCGDLVFDLNGVGCASNIVTRGMFVVSCGTVDVWGSGNVACRLGRKDASGNTCGSSSGDLEVADAMGLFTRRVLGLGGDNVLPICVNTQIHGILRRMNSPQI